MKDLLNRLSYGAQELDQSCDFSSGETYYRNDNNLSSAKKLHTAARSNTMYTSFTDLERVARTLLSVAPSISASEDLEKRIREAQVADSRGYFTPEEDDLLKQFFAQYLQARAALHETLDELKPLLKTRKKSDVRDKQVFLIAYAAATMLVRAARFLVDLGLEHPVLRKKLNEADRRFGLEKKKYAAIYKSLTAPKNVVDLYFAREFYRQHRDELFECANDSEVLKELVVILRDTEEAMDFDVQRYVRARLRYRWYSALRRTVSGYGKAAFLLLEAGGRVVAELKNPLIKKQGLHQALPHLIDTLKPGDILVTRHKQALSNVFLPGFWPHVALYIGDEAKRVQYKIECPPANFDQLRPEHDILEAKKDGVLFRNIEETLLVDYVAVIRPDVSDEELQTALFRGMSHAGKLYDFNFDFTISERLVCTEVVYRSFDGIGKISLPLTERAGRMTLSAEDLLHLALERKSFKPIAVFGVAGAEFEPVTGNAAGALIRASMEPID
jgi:hypothetical protein